MSQQPVSVKLVVVGDGSVGKTCVLISYSQNRFPTQYVPTVFDNYSTTIKVDGKMVTLGLWDTAGQEQYSRLRPLAYPNCDVFLIIFSVVQPDSWINAYKKWYPQLCQAVGVQVPKIFVGNKIDQREPYSSINNDPKKAPVRTETARKYIQENFKESKYLECSALTQEGLKNVFDEAIKSVLAKKVKPMARKNKESEGGCALI